MPAAKTTAKKPVAVKKSATAARRVTRKPIAAAKPTRRKSTAAPKRIIKRSKTTARSARAAAKKKAAAAAPARAERGIKVATRNREQGLELKKLLAGGKSLPDAAAALGISKGKARRLNMQLSVKGSDKIVGTDTEVGKAVVKAKDGGDSWPVLAAKTGKTVRALKSLYEQTSGNAPAGRAAKSTAKATTRRGRAVGKAARTAKATATKGGTAPKASARERRAKSSAKKAAAKEAAAPSGRPKGRRARRMNNERVLELVHDLDTDNDEVSESLEGMTLEISRSISGRPMRPQYYKVRSVKEVKFNDREGRLIEFTDENMQQRFVSSREITALK